MPLVLTEEQHLLKSTAEDFFLKRSPVSALRALRDNRDVDGFSRPLWQEIVAMGWPSAFLPEVYGGLDCGFMELGAVLEASGRTLAASPMISSVVLSASAILLGGTETQKSSLLPRIVSGDLLVSLALEEGPHHSPSVIATSAAAHKNEFLISGKKVHVIDGHAADQFIVVARTQGHHADERGISLFIVNHAQHGVSVTRRMMVDSRNMAEVQLQDVAVPAANLLGELHGGYGLLTRILDRGNIALSAEMLGSLRAAFDRTLDYLKQREQFGELIGSFQALQHRAARMFCEIELAKSVVLKALQAIDEGADNLSLLASLAKVQVAETYRLVGDEAIQMFGGIGMTDEEEIGFYLKRARVAQQLLGDENYHVQRYANLRGY
ncbi:MAG: acyl-CoA dehydrogenase family protein [Halioglobus sp.]|nr:acyl-CoA dehydrogenase family protein [Halioglobus sp.]